MPLTASCHGSVLKGSKEAPLSMGEPAIPPTMCQVIGESSRSSHLQAHPAIRSYTLECEHLRSSQQEGGALPPTHTNLHSHLAQLCPAGPTELDSNQPENLSDERFMMP